MTVTVATQRPHRHTCLANSASAVNDPGSPTPPPPPPTTTVGLPGVAPPPAPPPLPAGRDIAEAEQRGPKTQNKDDRTLQGHMEHVMEGLRSAMSSDSGLAGVVASRRSGMETQWNGARGRPLCLTCARAESV